MAEETSNVLAADDQLSSSALMDQPARLLWIDIARGITIVLVVYGHCYRGLVAARLVAMPWLQLLDHMIYGFHMPLFFFLSGVFSAGRAQARRDFWKRRIAVLLWPYLLWMSVELALLRVLSGLTNLGQVTISWYVYLVQPIAPFWFLYALLVCHLAMRALSEAGPVILLMIAAAAYVAGQFASTQIITGTTWGFFYFVLGTVLSRQVRKSEFAERLASIRVVLALGAGVLLVGFLFRNVNYVYLVPLALLGICFVFGLSVYVARAAAHLNGRDPLSYLGQITLTILVVHVLGTSAMRIGLTHLLHVSNSAIHIAAGLAAGLALPCALQWSATRLGLLAALGLSRPRFPTDLKLVHGSREPA